MSFYSELKRRNVVRVGLAYAIVSWLLIQLAGALEPELGAAERQRAVRRPPDSLKAWGLYQRGLSHMYRFTKVDNREAHRLLSLAAADDPLFAAPLGAQAYVWFLDFILGFVDDPELARAEAVVAGRAAVARIVHQAPRLTLRG